MKRKIGLVCGVSLLVAGLWACNGGYNNTSASYNVPNVAGATTITIPTAAAGKGTAAYGVNPLHLPVGSKVVWYNSDSMTHTSTSDSAVWDTGNLAPGSTSATVTFGTAGTFPYHCAIHGAASMSGTIIVP